MGVDDRRRPCRRRLAYPATSGAWSYIVDHSPGPGHVYGPLDYDNTCCDVDRAWNRVWRDPDTGDPDWLVNWWALFYSTGTAHIGGSPFNPEVDGRDGYDTRAGCQSRTDMTGGQWVWASCQTTHP